MSDFPQSKETIDPICGDRESILMGLQRIEEAVRNGLPIRLYATDLVQLRALLARADWLERQLAHVKADREYLWNTRDKQNHRWMETAERFKIQLVQEQTEHVQTVVALQAANAEIEHLRSVLEIEINCQFFGDRS